MQVEVLSNFIQLFYKINQMRYLKWFSTGSAGLKINRVLSWKIERLDLSSREGLELITLNEVII